MYTVATPTYNYKVVNILGPRRRRETSNQKVKRMHPDISS